MRRFHKLTNDIFYKEVVSDRLKYLSPATNTFTAYKQPFVINKGKGCYVWDCYGDKYLDLLGQNLTVSVGHCHPKIVESSVNQMRKLSHCTSIYYNEHAPKLARDIISTLPPHPSGNDWVVHFVNDGSEAIDLATQMIRTYTNKQELISLHKSYHGLQGYAAGLSAIGISTQPAYSSMYSSITHLPSNDVEAIENHVKYSSGGHIAGIVIEPLQGYGGIYPLKKGYMKKAFDIVREHGGVCLADEVQTGYNRCGEAFWGFQLSDNDAMPDIITTAKGMGNGVGIIGAVITTREIAEAFTSKMFFNTYGGNPVACVAARAVLNVMKQENIRENCKAQGDLFKRELVNLCKHQPDVYKEVRGEGLFLGLEVSGTTHEDSVKKIELIQRLMLDEGIMIGKGSAAGNVLRIQPPMTITEMDVLYTVDMLDWVGNMVKDYN